MKKTLLLIVMAIAGFAAASAQKFALVDMEYIFRNVPSYEMANEQLNQLSQRYQKCPLRRASNNRIHALRGFYCHESQVQKLFSYLFPIPPHIFPESSEMCSRP